MAALDWHTTREGEVTLVRLLVTSEVGERVEIENCLDGPVWPPRRQGVPEDGWTEDGFEGVVGPEDRLVVGYASPADPADPPARLVAADPVDGDRRETVTAREVVRTLGDPTPPRDAVPTASDERRRDPETLEQRADASDRQAEETRRSSGTDRPPAAVDSWLADVRRRVEEAERLAEASSVEEASEAVASVGGTADLAALREQLDADRKRLAELTEESSSLAGRIESVEVPIETLQRLA